MPKKKPKDTNKPAKSNLDQATNEGKTDDDSSAKNPAAQALGRLGGLKGGKARADSLTKKERVEIAKKAAKARWNNKAG